MKQYAKFQTLYEFILAVSNGRQKKMPKSYQTMQSQLQGIVFLCNETFVCNIGPITF